MIRHYLQLTRLQTSGLTIGMLLLTRWVAHGVEATDTFLWIIGGLLVHAGFFSMNEVVDHHHDRGHPQKVNPVTAGHIPYNRALSLSLATLTLSLCWFVYWWGAWSWTILPLLNSYIMGSSYNLRGKRVPRLAPWILGGWAFLLSLWVAGLSGFPIRAMWMPWAWGFMLLLQVLEGDLKDWIHDGRSPGGLDWHTSYMEYIQFAFIGAVAVGANQVGTPWVMISAGVMWITCYAMLIRVKLLRRFRKKVLKAMGVHNVVEYATVLVVCVAWVVWWALVVVFVVPLLMYLTFNRIGYGQAVAPSI